MSDIDNDRQGVALSEREELRSRFPEINFGNYGQDEVEALQAWAFEAYDLLADQPAEDAPAPVAQADDTPLVRFVKHLSDNCIGQVVTEEAMEEWALDVLDSTPREVTVRSGPRRLVASAPTAEDARADRQGVALSDWSRISEAAQAANKQYGQWMPERWLQLFVKAYNEAEFPWG